MTEEEKQVVGALMKRFPTLTIHGAEAIMCAVGKETAMMLTRNQGPEAGGRMHATITVYLDSSSDVSREEFEGIVKTLVDVASLSSVIENVDYEVVED